LLTAGAVAAVVTAVAVVAAALLLKKHPQHFSNALAIASMMPLTKAEIWAITPLRAQTGAAEEEMVDAAELIPVGTAVIAAVVGSVEAVVVAALAESIVVGAVIVCNLLGFVKYGAFT
jgi:hypothetical protein